MAVPTPCQTPGANFSTHITNRGMVIVVDFGRELTFDEAGAKLLEDNAHNSLEQNLARYY
jgi:hypothetical protein